MAKKSSRRSQSRRDEAQVPEGSGGKSQSSRRETRDEGNLCSPRINVQRAGAEIWTLSEMVDAEPVHLPEVEDVSASLLLDAADERERQADGIGGADAAILPSSVQAAEERPQAGGDIYDYPAPFTRHDVFEENYEQFPFMTVGKIFFRHNGRAFVGSAFSIGNYAVFTAGHCVHAGNGQDNGWFTDLVFVPAYRDGEAPFGQWPASHLMTRARWYNNGIPDGLTEDLGGAVLQKVGGKKISDVVGALGFTWNWSRVQHWHAMGYPAAAPFTGEVMVTTQASYAYDGTVSGIKPVGIGCDMTSGCSGGPWIRRFGTKNEANGLNSYRRSSHPLEMFSPYFDDRAKSLKDDLVAATP